MTTRKTPGKRLVEALNRALAPGTERTEQETVVLDLLEAASDRLAVLKALFDAETSRPQVSAHRVTELAGEIRQIESNIQRWATLLDPRLEAVKSARHVEAANARWHRHG
jgi:hypothetical protein